MRNPHTPLVALLGIRGNHLPELLQLVRVLERDGKSPVGVVYVSVMHDNFCPALSGGDCSCDPVVKLLGGAR